MTQIHEILRGKCRRPSSITFVREEIIVVAEYVGPGAKQLLHELGHLQSTRVLGVRGANRLCRIGPSECLAGVDEELITFDVVNRAIVHRRRCFENKVCDMAPLGNSTLVAVTSYDGSGLLWDTATHSIRRKFFGTGGALSGTETLLLQSNGYSLEGFEVDSGTKLWRMENIGDIRSIQMPSPECLLYRVQPPGHSDHDYRIEMRRIGQPAAVIAEKVWSLSNISDGRFVVGLASGGLLVFRLDVGKMEVTKIAQFSMGEKPIIACTIMGNIIAAVDKTAAIDKTQPFAVWTLEQDNQ